MIAKNLSKIKSSISEFDCELVAVSKTKPNEDLQAAYEAGQRIFGENKVQELCQKQEDLPKEIQWHMIGHLQSNKVKFIAPFVHLIHAIDSTKLLKEINKQGAKNNRVISGLLQIHIAKEDSKFGFSFEEAEKVITELNQFPNVKIEGVMGMATNTEDTTLVRQEFASLTKFYNQHKDTANWKHLSMGMSNDYKIALEEGSNLIRVGSAIFGARNYTI